MSRTAFKVFAICALVVAAYVVIHDADLLSNLARTSSFIVPHTSTAASDPWIPRVVQALKNIFRVIGFLVSLLGVVSLLGAVMASRGLEGYFRGGVLIAVGSVIARIALN